MALLLRISVRRLLGDDHTGRPQEPLMDGISLLDNCQHRIRLGRRRGLQGHCLVPGGIERFALGVDFGDTLLFQSRIE